jgi:hypothetical protein
MEKTMDMISVPVTINSLAAALSGRVCTANLATSPTDVLALIRLVETLDDVLDRLAVDVPTEAA